ncbi:MAG: hypothetical protein ACT4PV_10080 [Planctomycetaceae bacterium]
MRHLAGAFLMIVGAGFSIARGDTCSWTVTPNITEATTEMDSDSGSSGLATWTWQYVLRASHLHIGGGMSFDADNCTVSIAKSDSGNGTYRVERIPSCYDPQEDIEAYARNEFKAEVELDSETVASALGSKRIAGSSISSGKPGGGTLSCHAQGGVEARSSGSGSGTVTIEIAGIPVLVYWTTAGSDSRVFQDTDAGSNGHSPETITCQTNMALKVAGGGAIADTGDAGIRNSKAELTVWGTCNGHCNVIVTLMSISEGY